MRGVLGLGGRGGSIERATHAFETRAPVRIVAARSARRTRGRARAQQQQSAHDRSRTTRARACAALSPSSAAAPRSPQTVAATPRLGVCVCVCVRVRVCVLVRVRVCSVAAIHEPQPPTHAAAAPEYGCRPIPRRMITANPTINSDRLPPSAAHRRAPIDGGDDGAIVARLRVAAAPATPPAQQSDSI